MNLTIFTALWWRNFCWRQRERYRRLRRAWRYASGRLTADDAQTMMLECEDSAGWHPLIVLTVEDTLEDALELYADHPQLAQLIAEGCARVAHKWEDHSDILSEARRWALNIAGDYAIEDGVVLIQRDDARGVAT